MNFLIFFLIIIIILLIGIKKARKITIKPDYSDFHLDNIMRMDYKK